MDQGPLSGRIVEEFEAMPAQLREAARYVLERPREVALLSMREQARQAGVQPATMTRLAQRLGLRGYDDLRAAYAAALRDAGFAGRAGAQAATQKLKGDRGLAAEMLAVAADQVAGLGEEGMLDRIERAAHVLASARRVYCLGLRSSHAVAWHLHYILSLIGERSALVDGPAGTGSDLLAHSGKDDALFVVSVSPYTRVTVDLAVQAVARGVVVVTVTDSAVSPLARIASHAIIVPTASPSFFHAMSPAFVIAEILGAIVAGRGGEAAIDAVRRTDRHLATLKTHLRPRQLETPG